MQVNKLGSGFNRITVSLTVLSHQFESVLPFWSFTEVKLLS